MGKRKGRKVTQEIPELADEIGENGEEEGGVGFFACYLLTSLCPRFKGHTYIGYTLNPRRRIRQHNGEIGCGAWRTKRKRPWEMVLCIYGFPTNIAALQFEWAWQHPVESLAVRNAAASFKSLSGLANKIKLAYTMLTLPAWQRLNITVNLFSTKYQTYTAACPALPEQMRTQVCSMNDLPCYSGNTFVNNEWNDDHDENEFEEEESRILAAVNKSPSYDGSPGENEEISRRCDAGTEPSGCLARTQTGWPSNSPPNREEEEVQEQPYESPAKSSFSFARSYVDEDALSTRCAKSSRENDEPLNNRSATALVAEEDQILIKSPDIRPCEVEVIDLFTPSPCYAINSGRKKRRPNLCPEIIDLTNSPVYV